MTTANLIARQYDAYVSAMWRGETDDVRRFATWLKGFWELGGPPEPDGHPDAVRALGGTGASIRWYESDGVVFGYIPGVIHRCYQIPISTDTPMIAQRHEHTVSIV